MEEIPIWIIEVIEREGLLCRICNKKFNTNNLMSIGIQESSRPPHKDWLFIGLFCNKCKELIIFEVKEMSLLNFAFEILDQETSNKIKKKDQKEDIEEYVSSELKVPKKKIIKKSKITLAEIEDIKKFLKPKDLKHEDFLIAMGMSTEEIHKYNYNKKKR